MSTPAMLWFVLWRMMLWGLLLGAAAMVTVAAADTVVSLFIYRAYSGGAYVIFAALLFGSLGAIVGLLLGLLCGLVLFGLTRAFFWPRRPDSGGYRGAAGRACAAASVLVLMVDWTVRNLPLLRYGSLPDPAQFVVWRLFNSPSSVPSLDVATASNYALMVIFPTLLFALAMWWAGRRVAGQYAREFGETANHSSMQARGESQVEARQSR